MRYFNGWLGCMVAMIVALITTRTLAQSPGNSDFIGEAILDANNKSILNGLGANIPESGAEGNNAFVANFPARNLDFLEAGTTKKSDRLQINAYTVTITSDTDQPNGSLPRRAGAILIPAAANELFNPLTILTSSDGDPSGSNVSDSVTVVTGFWDKTKGPGTTVASQNLPELADENLTEIFPFTVPATTFDIEEPLSETGGVAGIISDYVDISQVKGSFVSSDNQTNYNLPADGDGSVTEDPKNGAQINYYVDFQSDVPEPVSLSLVLLGMSGLMVRPRRLSRPTKSARERVQR